MPNPTDRTLHETLHDFPAGELGDEQICGLVLTVVHHPNPSFLGLRHTLTRGQTVELGRHGRALGAGVLEDPLLSRKHAQLRWGAEDTLTLSDQASLNGCTVNGVATRQAELREGDVLGLGSLLLMVSKAPPGFEDPRHPALVGRSWPLARLLLRIGQVAPKSTTVLIQGETGVGKELVAAELHRRSGRPGAFVPVNCGAMAEGLLQAELFGYVKGAFTGADSSRAGLVQGAETGTLFLDEIGEAPPGFQVALLRLIQESEYRPLGSDRMARCDVRFVTATHRDLGQQVRQSTFREDLYARLDRLVLHVPALRERREDIPVLARHFATRHAGRPVELSRPLVQRLLQHRWPRNVRELDAWMERVVVEQGGEAPLRPTAWMDELLEPYTRGGERTLSRSPERSQAPARPQRPDAETLRRLLQEERGNIRRLSERLSVARQTLYRWFKELDVDPNEGRR